MVRALRPSFEFLPRTSTPSLRVLVSISALSGAGEGVGERRMEEAAVVVGGGTNSGRLEIQRRQRASS